MKVKKLKKLTALILSLFLAMAIGFTVISCSGSKAALTEISVELPNKSYEEGDTFDSTGMVVTATYEDGTEKEVTGYTILLNRVELTSDYKLKKTDTRITVSYTEGDVTKTKNVSITVTGAWTLTIKNATINGSSALALYKDDKLPASAEIKATAGDILGWQDSDGSFYGSYEDIAAKFVMPGRDDEILAVTSESFTQPFTPSCSYKNLVSYSEPNAEGVRTIQYDNASQKNEAFQHVQTAGGNWATRYVMSTKQDIGILNGVDETHKNSGDYEGLCNDCPYSDTVEKIILMNFTNNSNEAITILYGTEYVGIRGEVKVTLQAGESKSAYLKQLNTPAGKSGTVLFHTLCILEGGENGYDLTIYGMLAQ